MALMPKLKIRIGSRPSKLALAQASKADALSRVGAVRPRTVNALVSTTGLEDYGMINRVLMAVNGKPRGLLDMLADRPLTAKDLEPIPSDALLAGATACRSAAHTQDANRGL